MFTRARTDLFEITGSLEQIQRALRTRRAGLGGLTAQIQLAARAVVTLDASTVPQASTHSNFYVAVDAGLIHAPHIGTVAPYLGANIYLRPVNKDAALTQRGGFWRRCAVTVGLTGTEPGTAVDNAFALFGSQALLVGGGCRVTQSLRLGLGGLVFKAPDPNPLIDNPQVVGVPYYSFSFDFDVASILGRVFPRRPSTAVMSRVWTKEISQWP